MPRSPEWIVWALLRRADRVLLLRVFYVTAESWLNNSSSNETRGQTLSLYMIVQMLGIDFCAGAYQLCRPCGVLVVRYFRLCWCRWPSRRSCCPSAPRRPLTAPNRLSIRALYDVSPLGVVGIFLMGGVFSALFRDDGGLGHIGWAERAGDFGLQPRAIIFFGGACVPASHRLAVGPDGPTASLSSW